MARLNIYLPDKLHKLAGRLRKSVNFSEICARALEEELTAMDSARSFLDVNQLVGALTKTERLLARKFGLKDVVVVDFDDEASDVRTELGVAAASYLDRSICDGSILGIAGGRQTWSVVRNLRPRNVRTEIYAMGVGQLDPIALHTHPNTLLTLAWLLYAPRATAHLVGSTTFESAWNAGNAIETNPRYFVLASCAPFSVTSPFASLIGESKTKDLIDAHAIGDFAYVFFDQRGTIIPTQLSDVEVGRSILGADILQGLAKRENARVMLVAGGHEKVAVINSVLDNGLCNTLITDNETADQLLNDERH